MEEDSKTTLSKVIRMDGGGIRSHFNELVRGTLAEILNSLPDAEPDQ